VPLTARLPDFQLSMRDLANIAEGSIIPTSIPKDARVLVRAGLTGGLSQAEMPASRLKRTMRATLRAFQ